MIILPAISEYTKERPGTFLKSQKRLIPNLEKKEFWYKFKKELNKKFIFNLPIQEEHYKIDNLIGHFGERFHPIIKESNYFHIGLDFSTKARAEIFSIYKGIFEYSGFDIINGNYVYISHPEIKTEDGYILFSMYAHLKKYFISFSKYQKMLREISLHSYPNIAVNTKRKLALLGNSGVSSSPVPHVHLQCEFVKENKTIIAINPAWLFNIESKENLSANIKNEKEFEKLKK